MPTAVSSHEVSKRENYYGPGLTAVVMRKELK